jgi:hypothetical protein
VDISALTTMKNAAKRDMNCELQSSVNHRIFERIMRLWVTPLGMLYRASGLKIAY